MKWIFVRLPFLVLLFACCCSKVDAQPYKTLTIDDFLGAPASGNSHVIAYTNCSIEFKYQASRRNGYYLLACDIRLIINHYKSWLDRSRVTSPEMLQEVLNHEQGHYTIAYLEQQELRRVVGQTLFGADYQYQAMNIFNQIDAKYKQLNRDYDEDTGHMANREQQKSWDQYFRKRLNFLPPS
jgi:hypothetical protein